ncbi:hypothetical protein Pcac1_g22667 [Phytophthora cactorum]|nr:hypothetical protein Pcac1_g22667 [Phytophthora cactorum]
MFFYRCCAATLGNIEKRDRPKDQTQYKSFHETCQRYWANRERETAYTSESMLNTGALITETAKLMEINALNMIALHFRRRLHQYIRFRYARNYKETKKLVDSCYRASGPSRARAGRRRRRQPNGQDDEGMDGVG